MLMVYELKVSVEMHDSFHYNKHLQCLSKLIDDCFITDEWKAFHDVNVFKHYSFGGLMPMPKDRIYLAGRNYSFFLRTTNNALFELLAKELKGRSIPSLSVINVKPGIVGQNIYSELKTFTPAVFRLTGQRGGRYWRKEETMSTDDYLEGMKKNLLRKYEHLTGIKLPSEPDFATSVKFMNNEVISMTHKHGILSADTFTIEISPNQVAQELAYLAIGEGLFNQNPRGFGFVNWEEMKGL